jgi:hypothetical protein
VASRGRIIKIMNKERTIGRQIFFSFIPAPFESDLKAKGSLRHM